MWDVGGCLGVGTAGFRNLSVDRQGLRVHGCLSDQRSLATVAARAGWEEPPLSPREATGPGVFFWEFVQRGLWCRKVSEVCGSIPLLSKQVAA